MIYRIKKLKLLCFKSFKHFLDILKNSYVRVKRNRYYTFITVGRSEAEMSENDILILGWEHWCYTLILDKIANLFVNKTIILTGILFLFMQLSLIGIAGFRGFQ